MARKRRPFNLKSRITSALRRIWLYSPQRTAVSKQSRMDGNKCSECKKKSADRCDIDHVESVVGVEGFTDWSTYIKRLFEGELVPMCGACHDRKTSAMRERRKQHKNDLKRLINKAAKRKKR